MAVQMLYQHEIGGSTIERVFAEFDADGYLHATEAESVAEGERVVTVAPERVQQAFDYARRLATGTLKHGTDIDRLIRKHAENWRLERMPVIDRNILRLAIYEMFHESEVPKVVIVDEAIELAKKFGSEHSGRFVNGLLDGVLKSDETLPGVPSPAAELVPTSGAGERD